MLAKLSSEEDPIQIYKFQGELECLRIFAAMPDQIERLDTQLEKAQQFARMKDAETSKETVNG